MNESIDAIYEDGVFRPLEPLSLPDQTLVKVTVHSSSPPGQGAAGAFPHFAIPENARPLTGELVRQTLEETP